MPDVGNLTAKLTLDTANFKQGVSESESLAQKMASGIGKAVGAVATSVTALATASAVAIGNIVKEAVSSYADYEQLVGGVETLFKNSAGIVMDYAMEAYKTAGLSANEYMETVTSFSASLLQSLGGDTVKAADMSNMAITDMADNANKMGSSMESIQTAYQGFAKQNYSMLDNLKIGYGGTQAEMYRLLQDATALDSKFAETAQFAMDSSGRLTVGFNDVVQAIHIVQSEMGITGTTASEASTTITGSLNMVKASWADLTTSIAGGGKGMTEAIQAFTDSVKTFAGNLLPVIQEALYGIGDLITGIVPQITAVLPEFIATLLPQFIDAVMTLTRGIVDAFPQIISVLASALPSIVSELSAVISDMLVMLLEVGLPLILELAVNILLSFAQDIADNMDTIIPALLQFVNFLVDTIVMNAPLLLKAGLEIILAIVEGIVNNMDAVMDALAELVVGGLAAIAMSLPKFLELGVEIVIAIIKGILMIIPKFIEAIGRLLGIVHKNEEDVGQSLSNVESDLQRTVSYAETSSDRMHSIMSKTEADAESSSDRIESTVKSTSDNVQSWMEKTEDEFGNSVTYFKDESGKVFQTVKHYSNGNVETITETEHKIVDGFGRTISYVETSAEKMENSSANAESAVSDAMENVSKSADKAATSVESSVQRINNALGGIQGGSDISIGTRAVGGKIEAGHAYIAGELGPELIVPRTNGWVYTAEETADIFSGGGKGDIYITIDGDVYDDAQSVRKKFRSAMLDVLEEQMAYG